MPPRGMVGEPRQILSTNANIDSNHARDRPAASKPFGRPRDPPVMIEYNTSIGKRNKRGRRSNEARLRRIENRKYTRTENRRIYRTVKEIIPKEEWKLARPTPQESRALKAGGKDRDRKKHWHSQNEQVKYDEETRANAPKWKYAEELKVASLNVRGMREITKREQVVTYMKKKSIDLLRAVSVFRLR